MPTLSRLVALSTWFALTTPWTAAAAPSGGSPPAQLVYLKPPNTGNNDYFGNAVAVSGDTVVVGARLEDGSASGVDGPFDNGATNAGAAYVFVRSGSSWSVEAYLKASNPDVDDEFGTTVAIDGDTLVVGAPFEDSAATGIDGDASDNSANLAGAAYVFVRSGTTWSQQAYLKASNHQAGMRFGAAVAISGDTILVGAFGEGGTGAAYVFVRNGSTWTQEAYLKASNPGPSDSFGAAVSVSGDTAAVGSHREDSDSTGVDGDQANDLAPLSGAAYVFVRNGTIWTQEAYLKASNTDAGDEFGYAVTVFGDTVAVGAWEEDSASTGVDGAQGNTATDTGAVYVFERSGSSWSQEAYLKAASSDDDDLFGASLALWGDLLVVSAPFEDGAGSGLGGNPNGNAKSDAGALYAYRRVGSTWAPTKYVKASNSDPWDRFGTQVAVSGELVVSGAPYEDSASTQIDKPGVPDQPGFGAAGAVYAFELFVPLAYCVAKTNSDGCAATIGTCGTTSLGDADPMILEVSLVPAAVNGLLFYGQLGAAQLPFLGGTLCVQPPLKRTTIQNSGGIAVFPCDGTLAFDFTSWVLGGNDPQVGAGSPIFAQFWYRDSGDPAGVGLTNAVQFTLQP